jgi:CTP:molybdopterin cytidylyltransferase MocA
VTVRAAIVLATTTVPGIDGPLALAPWRDDEALVEYVVAQVLSAGIRDIEVVIAPDGEAIIPLVARDNVEPVIDPRGEGTASAIQIGATALPRGTMHALIIDVAEPRPASMLRSLIDAHAAGDAAVTRASHGGTTGAPFVAGEAVLAALRNVADADALSRVLALLKAATHEHTCDDPVVLLEVRSAEEMARTRQLLGGD